MKAHEIIDRLASLDEQTTTEEPAVDPGILPAERPTEPDRPATPRRSNDPYELPPDFEPGQMPRPKAEDESGDIQGWLEATQQPIQDWDWDGQELRLMMDDGSTEVYSRQQLEEIGVFSGEMAFAMGESEEDFTGIEQRAKGLIAQWVRYALRSNIDPKDKAAYQEWLSGQQQPTHVLSPQTWLGRFGRAQEDFQPDAENNESPYGDVEGPDPESVQAAIAAEEPPNEAAGVLDQILGRTPSSSCASTEAEPMGDAGQVIPVEGEKAEELTQAVSDVVNAILGIVADVSGEEAPDDSSKKSSDSDKDPDKRDKKKSDKSKGEKEKETDKKEDKDGDKKDAKKDDEEE
jgi:hypothetical protein